MKLKDIASMCGITAEGDDLEIQGATSLQNAKSHDISCFNNTKYINDLRVTQAGACFIKKSYAEMLPPHTIPLITDSPYADFGKALQILYPEALRFPRSDHRERAFIHPSAVIGKDCVIGPFCVLEKGVILGDQVILGAHCTLGQNVSIGDHGYLEDQVTLTHTKVGPYAFIKTGARIGQAGFGFEMTPQGPVDIPQLGQVIIHENVQIGANTCIDRGSLGETIIHQGVRIDNLVQIAHNVEIEANSIIVAQVGIAGSTHLGKFVAVGGQAGIAGHLSIGHQVQIAAQSGVMRNLEDKEIVGGSPAVPIRQWHRQTLYLKEISKKSL